MIDQIPEGVQVLLMLFAVPIVVTVSVGICIKILQWMGITEKDGWG